MILIRGEIYLGQEITPKKICTPLIDKERNEKSVYLSQVCFIVCLIQYCCYTTLKAEFSTDSIQYFFFFFKEYL